MLEWTGERFLPWVSDPSLAYEHLHRYAYAAKLVQGKRVLDLASGEGYGSNMLAQSASAVIGIDIDPEAVEHATARYGNRGMNVQFMPGSITSVPIPDGHSFDTVVCFEAIEHIQDQEALLGEVKRLLKPDGMLIVSTPNKEVYQNHSQEENPYHVKELTFDEFRELLGKYFKYVRFLGQRIHAQSSIWPMDTGRASSIQELRIERVGDEYAFTSSEKRIPLYFIALASDSSSEPSGPASILVDESNELLNENDRVIRELLEGKSSQTEALKWLRNQSIEDRKAIESLEEAVAWKESQVRELISSTAWMRAQAAELEKRIASRDETIAWHENTIASYQKAIASHDEALAWRAEQVAELSEQVEGLAEQVEGLTEQVEGQQGMLQNTQKELAGRLAELDSIHSSRGWEFILKIRRLREKLRGRG